MSIASMEAELREVERKIAECKGAKQRVEGVRANIQPKSTGWDSSFLALANNQELKEVKRVDSFEGEMADALSQKIEDVCGSIEDGLSKTERLISELQKQVNYLELKIKELEAEKQRLEREIAAEKARQAAAAAAAARAARAAAAKK